MFLAASLIELNQVVVNQDSVRLVINLIQLLIRGKAESILVEKIQIFSAFKRLETVQSLWVKDSTFSRDAPCIN